MPNASAVAPSDESLWRTNRLIASDGVELDPRTGDALEKVAGKDDPVSSSLAHWFA